MSGALKLQARPKDIERPTKVLNSLGRRKYVSGCRRECVFVDIEKERITRAARFLNRLAKDRRIPFVDIHGSAMRCDGRCMTQALADINVVR